MQHSDQNIIVLQDCTALKCCHDVARSVTTRKKAARACQQSSARRERRNYLLLLLLKYYYIIMYVRRDGLAWERAYLTVVPVTCPSGAHRNARPRPGLPRTERPRDKHCAEVGTCAVYYNNNVTIIVKII